MRFLLLCFLFAPVSSDLGCGFIDSTVADGAAYLVSKASCTCIDNSGPSIFDMSGEKLCYIAVTASGGDGPDTCATGNQQVSWWADDGVTAITTYPEACDYGESPLKTTVMPLADDGFWDVNDKASYEIKNNHVAIQGVIHEADSTAKKGGKSKPSDLKKGFMLLMDGELMDSTIYAAAKVGIKGSDSDDGNPQVFCAHTTRDGIKNLQTDKNKILKEADTSKRQRCLAGVLEDIASADELAHNAVGNDTKKCFSLPWKVAAQKDACTDAETCDRFVEGSPCITTTKIMGRAAATTTADHCLIQPGAGGDDKYRHLGETYSSQTCDVGFFCNPFARVANADPVCLEHVIGDGSVSGQTRVAGVLEAGSTTDHKWCIGVTVGAKRCAATEVCNPHAATHADLCINKTVNTEAVAMDFGAVGALAPTTGTDLRGYCIGDNTAGSICTEKTVCNYAAGSQSGDVDGGDICLAHTKLLGEIADTSPWTAVSQRKVVGATAKYCLATNGTTYSSKVCTDQELCNPHAATPSDVCIKTITVLNHAEIAPLVADPVSDSKTACIGLNFWKSCKSETTDGVKEVCNEGAELIGDVCILTTDCVNEEIPKEGFYVPGVELADDRKWCFASDGAKQCVLDEICNPGGEHGGTNSKAICADATKRVPHGTAADSESDPPLIHCYGKTGNSVLAADDTQAGWLCDEGKGVFHDPTSRMEGRAAAPPASTDGSIIADMCFGDGKVEKCSEGVYCNGTGTETGCSGSTCTVENICVTVDSVIEDEEQWVEEGKSICLNSDATAGENCTSDKMYCDQSTGACVAEAIAPTQDPNSSSDTGGGTANGSVARSLAAAAVVAILSA